MKSVILLILFAFLAAGCSDSFKADIPSYIRIESIEVTSVGVNAGATTSNITDAWVYLNNQAIGVFELPATIPILHEGAGTLTIQGGIKNNGISTDRDNYPFYTNFEQEINLVPDSVIEVNPVVNYKSDDFNQYIVEGFENVTINLEPGSANQAIFTTTTNPEFVLSGNRSGYTELTDVDSIMHLVTSDWMFISTPATVYMELDYKIDNTILISTVTQRANGRVEDNPFLFLNPETTDGWTKMYIDLTENINFYSDAIAHKISLIAIKDPDGTSNERIALDNFKIIYSK